MAKLHQFPKLFSLTARKAIGIMGGSFNPAHDGHRHIADLAVRKLNLDELWWLVSPQNPLKTNDEMARFEVRIKAALAVAQTARYRRAMVVSGLEGHFGTVMTYATLMRIRRHVRGAILIWIMGGDNLLSFHRWNRPRLISEAMAIAVVNRPGSRHLGTSQGARLIGRKISPQKMQARKFPRRTWCYIQGALNSQSATALRKKSP